MRPVNLYLSFLGKMYQDQMQLRRICNKNTMASICNNSMPVQPNLIGSYKIAMPFVANTTMVNSHNSHVQATNNNSLSFMRVGKMEILLMTILSSQLRRLSAFKRLMRLCERVLISVSLGRDWSKPPVFLCRARWLWVCPVSRSVRLKSNRCRDTKCWR